MNKTYVWEKLLIIVAFMLLGFLACLSDINIIPESFAHEVNDCTGGRKVYCETNANIELKVYVIEGWFWTYSHSVYTDNESCYDLNITDNQTYGFVPQVDRPWSWKPEYKDNQTKDNQ